MSKFDFKGILTQNNQVKDLPIDILVPYHNHQFKLYSGERLEDMVESVRQNGILNPILVQPIDNGCKYEILSGHNRVESAKLVGLEYIPAIVKENLSQDEAEMYVIETNLMQRGFNDLLISEQAHVLKIQHSKMFSQGKRNDIITELKRLENRSTSSQIEKKLIGNTSLDKVGNEYGMSRPTVARLLRINYLIEPFKDMINSKKMPIMVGVELSYISENVQKIVYQIISSYNKKIDMKLSKTIRNLYNEDNNVTMEALESLIISEKKSIENKLIRVPLKREIYSKFFGKKTSTDEIADTIQKALEMYFNKKN